MPVRIFRSLIRWKPSITILALDVIPSFRCGSSSFHFCTSSVCCVVVISWCRWISTTYIHAYGIPILDHPLRTLSLRARARAGVKRMMPSWLSDESGGIPRMERKFSVLFSLDTKCLRANTRISHRKNGPWKKKKKKILKDVAEEGDGDDLCVGIFHPFILDHEDATASCADANFTFSARESPALLAFDFTIAYGEVGKLEN